MSHARSRAARPSRSLLALALLVAASAAPSPLRAQSASATATTPKPRQATPAEVAAAPSAAAPRGLRDRAELEAFLDGVMSANMRDKHVAGATVSVVKDGQLFFAKGYGWANVAKHTPVNAERTLFRIGSISKLFTWTAIMQLVEQGKLDLDTDVNRYLDFKIPDTYSKPITLRNIMTHTPGFEEDGRDLFTEDSTRMIPMGKWLATHMPARVRPPGTYSSYSNYATALAGYIVQRVSGVPWDDYIEQHILVPLGMTQTTTRQPLPARFTADMSNGYTWGDGQYTPHPFEIVNGAAPAGSIGSSATDMAKFMIAQLNNGEYNGARILAESTAVRMHSRTFTHDPRLNGFALGFYEKSSNGLRIIGHGGDTRWFHSDLALIPSEKVGVFVSYNTATGGELSFGPFLAEFLDHYYPVPPVAAAPPPDAVQQAAAVAGEYEFNRRSYTTFQKALGLAGDIKVSALDSGALAVHGGLGDMRLVPVGPMLWRDELSGGLVAFERGSGGKVEHGFIGAVPMMVMDRVSWSARPMLHWFVLGLAVVVFLATIITAVLRFFRVRAGKARAEDALPGRWLLATLAILNIAFLVTVITVLGASGGLLENPLTGLKIAFALPVIAALLTVGALAMSVRQWSGNVGTRGARLRYAGIVIVALLFVWSLNQWNLLGWRM